MGEQIGIVTITGDVVCLDCAHSDEIAHAEPILRGDNSRTTTAECSSCQFPLGDA
jgi:hypothetical protein